MSKDSKMKKLTLDELNAAHEKILLLEPNGGFYEFAKNFAMRDNIHEKIAGALILIATWNSGRFRFANKSTIIGELGSAILYSQQTFKELENERLDTANLDAMQDGIKEAYNLFSRIKGVEYTGASKLMSLNNTGMFVMWDEYIRNEYGFGQNADEYVRFLKECQQASKGIKLQDSLSIAKAIDEYNYINISYPAVQKEKQKEKERQNRAREEKIRMRQAKNETKA